MSWGFGFRPYVSVAQRQQNAKADAAKLAKKEKRNLSPVHLAGRNIATSFWGKAWCDHLESHSDYENRLPRGRTYVRNGSVIDLSIGRGKIQALVSGSEIYHVNIEIKTLPSALWSRILKDCSRSVNSLMDLLQGKFDRHVMERLTTPKDGLFPQPSEIKMKCSCPDWATMCKHVAAVLYGVGARLDASPELLFTLRDVDHLELISRAADANTIHNAFAGNATAPLADSDLGEIFGIDLESAEKKPAPLGKTKKVAPVVAEPKPAPLGKTKKVAPVVAEPKPAPRGKTKKVIPTVADQALANIRRILAAVKLPNPPKPAARIKKPR